MNNLKTHTFKGIRYIIDFCSWIGGVTDVEDGKKHPCHLIVVKERTDFRTFANAFHECLHAMQIPDRYVHDKDGCLDTDDGARFLWRVLKEMDLK